MPRMMIIDTYYPEVFDALGQVKGETYDQALRRYLDLQFGTSDFYSRHLRTMGWDVVDVIANSVYLQSLWERKHGCTPHVYSSDVVHAQIEDYKPDVLFLQNLTILGSKLHEYSRKYFIAGQCSCAIRREVINDFRVIFTSFPHYVIRYSSLYDGASQCRFVYNPLAFEADCCPVEKVRDLDVVFVGGVGRPSHWSYGMQVLEAIACEFPDNFQWWGYGANTLSGDSPLIDLYQGTAWGRQMFDIFSRAKIVINRHGEISSNFANNMRMYEATGCGAMLLTEHKINLLDLFTYNECGAYISPADAVACIRYYLRADKDRQTIAAQGQQRTLTHHNYFKRMKTVSDTILEMM